MAQLRDTQSLRVFQLRAHHTVGRCTERSDTVITNPITSRIHLALEWDGRRWQVRDLSKNGTWLGGRRLQANESVPIAVGDRIHVGAPDLPPLELVDDTPPRSALLGISPETPDLSLEPFVFLPDQSSPEAVLIYSHKRHSWLLHPVEHDSVQATERIVLHGDHLRYGGREWQVFLAETERTTELSQTPEQHLEDIEFIFDLSQDEEHTALKLDCSGELIDLGERSHHYLLMHLARVRATDAENGLDHTTQGWLENELLKRDLGLDMPHINIMIFRARKQIGESLTHTLDSEHLIERGKGRMRFGASRVRIYKGDHLAFALPPAIG